MFSLRALFIVIGVAAFAFAAMGNNRWIVAAFVLFTLAVLCWAFLEREIAFWRGLLVFGLVYLLSAIMPVDELSDRLPSTRIYRALEVNNSAPTMQQRITARAEGRDSSRKRTVLHCAFALSFGMLGGLLYQWHTDRRRTSCN